MNSKFKHSELIDRVYIGTTPISVYSNGDSTNVSNKTEFENNGDYLGISYQCVSLVREYLFQKFNVNVAKLWSDGDAKDWHDNRDKMHLLEVKFKNVDVGDILTMDGGKWGHVAIVSKIDEDNIYIVSQNFMNDERDINTPIPKQDIIDKKPIQDGNGSDFTVKSFLRPDPAFFFRKMQQRPKGPKF